VSTGPDSLRDIEAQLRNYVLAARDGPCLIGPLELKSRMMENWARGGEFNEGKHEKKRKKTGPIGLCSRHRRGRLPAGFGLAQMPRAGGGRQLCLALGFAAQKVNSLRKRHEILKLGDECRGGVRPTRSPLTPAFEKIQLRTVQGQFPKAIHRSSKC